MRVFNGEMLRRGKSRMEKGKSRKVRGNFALRSSLLREV